VTRGKALGATAGAGGMVAAGEAERPYVAEPARDDRPRYATHQHGHAPSAEQQDRVGPHPAPVPFRAFLADVERPAGHEFVIAAQPVEASEHQLAGDIEQVIA